MRETRFFDEEFRMKAWLYRVTSNLCFNNVRDRRRRGNAHEQGQPCKGSRQRKHGIRSSGRSTRHFDAKPQRVSSGPGQARIAPESAVRLSCQGGGECNSWPAAERGK